MRPPVIGLVQVGFHAIADRYTYIPLIGLFVSLVWGSAALSIRHRLPLFVPATAGILAIAACVALTQNQVKYWRTNFTLFQHALAVTKDNPVALFYVGNELAQQRKYDQALERFRACIVAAPAYADGYNGLGATYELMGQFTDALAQYSIALKLKPWDEWLHNRLGVVLWKLGRHDEALQHYAEALRLRPDYADAHFNFGSVLAERGEQAGAASHLAQAVRLKPDNTEALHRLAEAQLKQGLSAEAEASFQKLVRLAPTDPAAHINLGAMLWMRGQREEAIQHYAEAVRLRPDNPVAQYNLAAGLFAQNKFEQAAARFLEALRFKSDYPEALTGLGRALGRQGKLDEAIARFQESLRLRPEALAWYYLALAQLAQGLPKDALNSLQQSLKLKPDWAPAQNELAWTLATHPQAEIRNGAEAVRLAESACRSAGDKDPRFCATLDAAYAEAGRFDDAIRTAEKTRALALASGQGDLAQAAEARLALYRKQLPFHK
jgi:protein O-mannosyl-transferase